MFSSFSVISYQPSNIVLSSKHALSSIYIYMVLFICHFALVSSHTAVYLYLMKYLLYRASYKGPEETFCSHVRTLYEGMTIKIS